LIFLKLISYNIHKGFSTTNLSQTLHRIKTAIDAHQVDLLCVQELAGEHRRMGAQLEILADKTWSHYAYGKNSVYSGGHHGNAILSQFPIKHWENIDISESAFEKRGMLHIVLDIPKYKTPLHVINTHLGLFHSWRKNQLEKLCQRIEVHLPREASLIVCGDFNDWNEYASQFLAERLNLREVFMDKIGSHAKTFPSFFPLLRLDRIYTRNIVSHQVEVLAAKKFRGLSDHLPIFAELGLPISDCR
jgi:endonuclease/exonuclease/phosphatase family metal-dependent hydrolase